MDRWRILYGPDMGSGGADESGDVAGDTTPTAGDESRTFTQDEVNQFVAERAKRARSAAVGDLLKELGYERVEDLRAAIRAQREAEDAGRSELEKAQARIAALEAERTDWAQRQRAQALQIAVQREAARLGVVDAEVALALVAPGIEYDDQGVPQGVDAALQALLEAKPYLRATVAPTSSPTNPAIDRNADDEFTTALYRGAGLTKD